jgi:23S rRNA pseudouridine1911/1915/1917 synthase
MDTLPRTVTATRGDAGRRLDLVLRRYLADVRTATRTRVQAWIEQGHVSVNGTPVRRTARRVAFGDTLAITVPHDLARRTRAGIVGRDPMAPERQAMAPEDVPLEVLYEDDHLLAVDKAAGVVVHPAYRNTAGTVMNALVWRARAWPADQRPSIVGRLDKLTTGILVVAKTAAVHAALQRELASRDAEKDYLAVVYGRVNVARGEVCLPLARDSRDRRRVTVSPTAGAQSVTRFERIARAAAPAAGLSLVRCRLVTGRMHQIRVHLAARGWPLVGDPVYGEPRWSAVRDPALSAALRAFPRQALHAWRLAFRHPATGATLRIEAPPPHDLAALLSVTGRRDPRARHALKGVPYTHDVTVRRPVSSCL